jgi:hypothetical protein
MFYRNHLKNLTYQFFIDFFVVLFLEIFLKAEIESIIKITIIAANAVYAI